MNKSVHAVLIACLIVMSTPALAAVLHTEKSLYRNIVVYTDNELRCMRFGRYEGNRQSCLSTTAPQRLVFNYTRMMMGALYLNPAPQRALVIGLGGGTLPNTLQRLFPSIQLDVAEIDPAVVRVARKYFAFNAAGKIHISEEDGRVFVKRALRQTKRYDLIMLDAFDHEYIPEHMLTREFLEEVRGLLSEHGVLAANTFSSSRLYDYESITYQTVFGDFFNLKDANRVILLRQGGLPDKAELQRNAAVFADKFKPLDVDSDFLLPKMTVNRDWPANTRVLTDQYSPANLLNSR
jgi:spermidine synthase